MLQLSDKTRPIHERISSYERIPSSAEVRHEEVARFIVGAGVPTWPADPTWPLAALSQELLDITNRFRALHGAGPLSFSQLLMPVSNWKASNMAAWLYMDHNTPAGLPTFAAPYNHFPGRQIGARFADLGYPTNVIWAENIAYGFPDAQSVFNAFISAGPGEGHYDNIVNPAYDICSFSVAMSANGLMFWVQDFGAAPYVGTHPSISSVTPTTAPVGGKILIAGSALERTRRVTWVNDVSNVNMPMIFTTIDDSHVTTVVPVGASSGIIMLETSGGFTGSPHITVGSAPPPKPPVPAPPQVWTNKTNGNRVEIVKLDLGYVYYRNLHTGKVGHLALKQFTNRFDPPS